MASRLDAQHVVRPVQDLADVVGPTAYVALAEPHGDAPVEDLHHRQRVHLAAVDAGDRDGAAASYGLDGGDQRRRPVEAILSVSGRGEPSGSISDAAR